MDFKDIEIVVALSKDSAYSTMAQHTWGTAAEHHLILHLEELAL